MAPKFDDLTARARIREAALEQFAEHGFERTTIRGIAAAAGVSSGLVRHHFGAKTELRDAVDAHVVSEIQRMTKDLNDAGAGIGVVSTLSTRDAVRPLQRYLVRALQDGSPTIAVIFGRLVDATQEWLEVTDKDRPGTTYADTRTRAAVIVAMKISIPLLHKQLSDVLGIDTMSPDGETQVALAGLDLFMHPLVEPAVGDAIRDALLDPSKIPAKPAGGGSAGAATP